MLTDNFYFKAIRKTTANFGDLFDNIEFVKDDTVSPVESFIVPLSFAPRNLFISRLNEKSSIDNDSGEPIVAYSLPTMTFEIDGFEYDSERKTNTVNPIVENSEGYSGNPDVLRRTYFNVVPYNITYNLNVFARKNEDILQILEQILPYFQPSYTLNIELSSELGIKKDVPVILDSTSFEDEWQNQKTDFRLITLSMSFTVKSYIIPPIQDQKVIKEVQANVRHSEDDYLMQKFTFTG